MINPLALKVGLGGVVVTGAGTTGIVYKNEIKDFFEKQFSKNDSKKSDVDGTDQSIIPTTTPSSTYVIVKAKNSTDNTTVTTLYTGNNSNFKCVLTGTANKEDDACEIFNIADPEGEKLNNLEGIKNSNTKATKQNITENKLFKLTIKDSVLSSVTWDGTQTIDIVEKTTTTNKFGSFSLQYKVVDSTVTGKTNWIIGQVTGTATTDTITDASNLTCSINGESTSSACLVFKIETTETDIKNIKTSNITAPTTNKDDYAIGKFFVIDLKRTDKKNISDFAGTTTITVNVTSGSVKIGDFSFVTALVDNGTFATTSKTIILS